MYKLREQPQSHVSECKRKPILRFTSSELLRILTVTISFSIKFTAEQNTSQDFQIPA